MKAQTALQKGKPPGVSEAADYAEFFNVPMTLEDSIQDSTQTYFKTVLKQGAEQEESIAIREQHHQWWERTQEDLTIFLLGMNFSDKTVTLFSIAKDAVVVRSTSTVADAWELADELMRYTKAMPQMLIIPVVESEKERRVLAPHLDTFTKALRQCGLQPVTHVDTLELARSFDRDPPPLRDVTQNSVSLKAPVPLTEEWFRAYWVYLRTLACKAVDADPIHTINTYLLPRYDVFVVHLVRAGSRSLNISIWDPVRRRRFVAKGMLPDILACLFNTHSTRMILIPTNRTDRPSLFRCRTALQKAGSSCVICFSSEINEKYRQAYHPDPLRYWSALKEMASTLDADLLLSVYVTAGNTMRGFHQKHLREGGIRPQLNSDEGGDNSAEDAVVATATDVEKWAEKFCLPKRLAMEQAELRHYKKYLVVAYTATDQIAYGRPNNPVADVNYVMSTCLVDWQGHLLQPWAKFTARGQFGFPSLDDFDVLVAHDAKQLLLLTWNDPQLQRFLKRGGRVWCTMLAEYLLEAQRCRTGSNGLHDVALKYGFLLPPSTVLGVVSDELPLAFLRRHLLEAAPAVRSIFTNQLQRSYDQRQAVSVAHRMDSLLAMASMEWSGIHVDVDEAERQFKALRTAAITLDRALEAHVPPEVPLDMREFFDWHSLPQLHALFFGGVITIGHSSRARDSPAWTSNVVHLCHRYGPFQQMVGELHLQRYAAQCAIPGSGKLPQRIAQFMEKNNTQKNKRYRLVLFDIETTGLNVSTDEIIEVAFFDPVENASFTSLVNPKRRITPRTIDIHHITDDMVKDAPTIDEVVPGVIQFLRLDAASRDPNEVIVLLGHNVFGIDEPMLRHALDVHSADSDHDGLLFCDSVVLLKSLKGELQNTRQSNNKVDRALLETLTTSLRLGSLIESLNVTPEGHLHRADTDTKALWFVLIHAFGLMGQKPTAQRDALLTAAATSLAKYPATGCFVPSERKRNTVQVRLPGIAHQLIPNPKAVAMLEDKQMGETVLQALHARGVSVAGLLLQRTQLDQHSSRFLQHSGDGHLTVLHPDRAVHQCIDMTATTTSRTTSAFPSCQNIPKDDKSSVRRLFVSRFGSEGRCIEVDYSQLEIVVLAILCGDPNLTRDLNHGVDFHVKRAEFFSGLPYKEIYEGYKRGVPKYTQLRKTAKQFSFQRLYGAGVPLLHKTTGIPVRDLEASIAAEAKEYPEIAAFHRVVRAVALRPNNPGLPTGFITELPTGLRMSFRTRDVILNLPPLKNYPIQGYGAELAQMMVGRLFRHFVKKEFYHQKAFLINFVHDSVWVDCHVDVLEECLHDTCRILSDVHHYVPKRFPGVQIPVPLKVAAACGVDMCSMQSVDGNDLSFVFAQKKSTGTDIVLPSLPEPAFSSGQELAE